MYLYLYLSQEKEKDLIGSVFLENPDYYNLITHPNQSLPSQAHQTLKAKLKTPYFSLYS